MAKSKGKPSGSGRLSWDGRLWDPSGVLYEREVEELTRSEAFDLVRDPDIQVAVSHASRPLRWLAPDERQRVWREELAPNFHDEPKWKPPTGAPGQLPVPRRALEERSPWHRPAYRSGLTSARS